MMFCQVRRVVSRRAPRDARNNRAVGDANVNACALRRVASHRERMRVARCGGSPAIMTCGRWGKEGAGDAGLGHLMQGLEVWGGGSDDGNPA